MSNTCTLIDAEFHLTGVLADYKHKKSKIKAKRKRKKVQIYELQKVSCKEWSLQNLCTWTCIMCWSYFIRVILATLFNFQVTHFIIIMACSCPFVHIEELLMSDHKFFTQKKLFITQQLLQRCANYHFSMITLGLNRLTISWQLKRW